MLKLNAAELQTTEPTRIPKLFIVILSYNSERELLRCLNSLKNEPGKIVIVDNASDNNSVHEIKKITAKEKRIKLIENKKNIGFAAGNNVGIRYALSKGADYVLLLNQDTQVKKGFLKPLLASKTDIISPVIVSKRKNTLIYDYGGTINWVIGRTCHLESDRYFEKGPLPETLHLSIEYISGCAMLVKSEVFAKIGEFSENFFLYFEDVDFCIRAKKEGFSIACERKSVISHTLKEGKEKPWRNIYYLLVSNLRFINYYVFFWNKPFAYLYWILIACKLILTKTVG